VPLRNHTVKADREHELDVEVDGVQVMTLTARLDVALQVSAAVAVVRDGHPVGVRPGQAHATGGLRVACVEIAQRTLTFPLPGGTHHAPPPQHVGPAGRLRPRLAGDIPPRSLRLIDTAGAEAARPHPISHDVLAAGALPGRGASAGATSLGLQREHPGSGGGLKGSAQHFLDSMSRSVVVGHGD
jgi:hypothetical protein